MATYLDALDGKHTDGSEQESVKAERCISDAEYIENLGSQCIYCKSENIVGGDTDFDAANAYRYVQCSDCLEEWEEVFEMTSTQPIGGL